MGGRTHWCAWGIQGRSGSSRKQASGLPACLEAAGSQSESHHEPVQHRCNRDRVHERWVHLRKDDQLIHRSRSERVRRPPQRGGENALTGRKTEDEGVKTRTTTPAPALRTKCSSPCTSPMLYRCGRVGRKNAITLLF